jgi:hypothetical protein
LLITIFSMIIGAGITFYAAEHYYKKATEGLLEQVKLLRGQNHIMLSAMESAGMATLVRDPEGNIRGITYRATISHTPMPEIMAGVNSASNNSNSQSE